MVAQAAAHHQIGGYRRIVPPGNQSQDIFDTAQWITAQSAMFAVGDMELVVMHFNSHFNLRRFQIDTSGLRCLHQGAADRPLQIDGAEVVLAMAPGPDGKGFAFQPVSKRFNGFVGHIVKADKRKCPDFLNRRNTRYAQKRLQDRAGESAAIRHFHIHPVPATVHPNLGIQPCQQFSDVLPQVTHLLTTDRFTLDRNFRSGTNKQFHKSEFCRVAYCMERP